MPGSRVIALVTKPDWYTKKRILWESDESEEEYVVVINNETDEIPHSLLPQINKKQKHCNSNPRQWDTPDLRNIHDERQYSH